MKFGFTPEAFLLAYPEFNGVNAARIVTGEAIASGIVDDFLVGISEATAATAYMLLVAHVVTILQEGASPIKSHETKESKMVVDPNSRAKNAQTFNLQLTDYGVLLNTIIDFQYPELNYNL